ncbi:MAG TPA: 50S ribosomal protein L18e [Candidatus Krumholzibacteriaceae bacterium]|nr:50S ribosomal protein L18e [Candidatus Krumholzibacteriaceae bacterium]
MKNQTLKDTIQALMKASDETGKAIWRALAEELDKPKRRRVAVNLSRIDRHAEEGEVVAVPGKVLAAGSLSKPLKVAAFQFSEGAMEKISMAKGEAMTLTELLEAGVEPSKIRIMK